MKPAFSLIELVIAIFIASLISVALYNTFFVTNKVLKKAQETVNLDMRLAIVHNQLEKDIQGIFTPPIFEQQTTTTATEKTPEGEKRQTKIQKKKIIIENIFYSTNKDKNISVLSFLTSNPIAVYEDAQAPAKPHFVRVVYRLSPDEQHPNAFKLTRQESTILDLKAFEPQQPKPIRSYKLAGNIRAMTAEYQFPIKKEEKPKKETKEPVEFKKVSEWQKKEGDKNQPPIPQFITFTIDFWNNDLHQQATEFPLTFQIPTFAAAITPEIIQNVSDQKIGGLGPEKNKANAKIPPSGPGKPGENPATFSPNKMGQKPPPGPLAYTQFVPPGKPPLHANPKNIELPDLVRPKNTASAIEEKIRKILADTPISGKFIPQG